MSTPSNPDPETATDFVLELWRRCMADTRIVVSTLGDRAPVADSVQLLIENSRTMLANLGITQRSHQDAALSIVLSDVHFNSQVPCDKIFETLLDSELTEFFRERGVREFS